MKFMEAEFDRLDQEKKRGAEEESQSKQEQHRSGSKRQKTPPGGQAWRVTAMGAGLRIESWIKQGS